MKAKLTFVITLIVMLVLLLSGISPIGLGRTLTGMQQVTQSAPGSFAMTNQTSTLYLLAWQESVNYGFAAIDAATKAPITNFIQLAGAGNCVDLYSMSSLVTCLTAHGWKYIDPKMLPYTITYGVSSWWNWLRTFGTINPTLIIMPMLLLTPPANIPAPQQNSMYGMPLWVVLSTWILRNRRPDKIISVPYYIKCLDEAQRSLPVPVGRLETFLVTKVNEYIDRERLDAHLLIEQGIFMTGQMSK